MYLSIKLIHIIAAMVYFGLPIAFGRWFRSCTLTDETKPLADALAKINMFVRLHLNICAAVLVVTGVYLAMVSGAWAMAVWTVLSFILLFAALVNANLMLLGPVNKLRASLEADPPSLEQLWFMRRRLAVFSGTHHTLVTLLTALMVFRP